MTVNVVVLGGRVASEPVRRAMDDGTERLELNIRVEEDVDEREWMPLRAVIDFGKVGPGDAGGLPDIRLGDELVITGSLRRRFISPQTASVTAVWVQTWDRKSRGKRKGER